METCHSPSTILCWNTFVNTARRWQTLLGCSTSSILTGWIWWLCAYFSCLRSARGLACVPNTKRNSSDPFPNTFDGSFDTKPSIFVITPVFGAFRIRNVSRNVPRRYSEIWLLVSHYWHSGLQEDVWSSWQDCCCKKQLKSGLFDGKWTVFVQFGDHTFVFLHNSSQRNQLISFHHAIGLGLDEQEILNRIASNQF